MTITENEIDELMAQARGECCPGCRVRLEIGFLYCRVEHLTGEPGAIQFYDPTVADML